MDSDEDDDSEITADNVPSCPINKTKVVQQNIDLRRLITRDKLSKKQYSPIRTAIRSANPHRDVEPALYFQTGPYTGLFSEYDEDGVPLKHIDGSIISNTQSKKLMKILVRHMKDYNRRYLQRKRKQAKNQHHTRRAHELLEQRKLPKELPDPEVYWTGDQG